MILLFRVRIVVVPSLFSVKTLSLIACVCCSVLHGRGGADGEKGGNAGKRQDVNECRRQRATTLKNGYQLTLYGRTVGSTA